MIPALINKTDTFELVRDKVAQILADEFASQEALATAGGEDPSLWRAKIYTERAHPWELGLNDPTVTTPIVNVWFDTSSFDKSAGNVVERQQATATINVDCYGFATASATVSGGHTSGDESAARESHRVARLCRNILMAAEYTYLDMRGVVGRRWVNSMVSFQPQQGETSIAQRQAVRLQLEVTFNELSPQVAAETLDAVHITLKQAADGQVVAEYLNLYSGAPVGATSASIQLGSTPLAALSVQAVDEVQAGDLLFFVVIAANGLRTISPPAGVTQILQEGEIGSNVIGLFTKVATASEPTSYAFTLNSSDYWSIGLVAFRGLTTVTLGTLEVAAAHPAEPQIASPVNAPASGVNLAIFTHEDASLPPPVSGGPPDGLYTALELLATPGTIGIYYNPFMAAGLTTEHESNISDTVHWKAIQAAIT